MTQRSPPKGGSRAGYDEHKRHNGRKTHAADDIRSHLLALVVTPTNERDRAQIEALITAVPTVVGQSVE